MTICPIAIAVGCKKCPIFKICPVKSVIGDMPKATAVSPAPKPVVRTVKRPVAARKKSKK